MDKKFAGLLGAAAALASMNSAQAATPASPTEMPRASSYADLLNPIPNAVALQIADDTARAAKSSAGEVELAQIQIQVGHHHHHHRHHRKVIVVPRRHRDHHHHSQYMAVPKASV